VQDGDGTDDRTGWPAVIRGDRWQYREWSSAQHPKVQFAEPSSAVGGQYLGEGVGCWTRAPGGSAVGFQAGEDAGQATGLAAGEWRSAGHLSSSHHQQ
jgi:hypothetical protein